MATFADLLEEVTKNALRRVEMRLAEQTPEAGPQDGAPFEEVVIKRMLERETPRRLIEEAEAWLSRVSSLLSSKCGTEEANALD